MNVWTREKLSLHLRRCAHEFSSHLVAVTSQLLLAEGQLLTAGAMAHGGR